jgi:hypothetical protein
MRLWPEAAELHLLFDSPLLGCVEALVAGEISCLAGEGEAGASGLDCADDVENKPFLDLHKLAEVGGEYVGQNLHVDRRVAKARQNNARQAGRLFDHRMRGDEPSQLLEQPFELLR